jgi:hypothetical protein
MAAYGSTNGFSYCYTAEGGASVDAVYAEGSAALVNNNNKPAWWNSATLPNANFNIDADWIAFFPNDGTNGTAPTGTVLPGCPGKQWLTIRLEVFNGGATRVVALKRSADADFTVVSTISDGVGSALRPCIGYMDTYSGVGTDPEDRFVVFDNLVIEEIPSVSEWNKY